MASEEWSWQLKPYKANYCDRCRITIAEYRGAEGPYALRLNFQLNVLTKLKEMVAYSAAPAGIHTLSYSGGNGLPSGSTLISDILPAVLTCAS